MMEMETLENTNFDKSSLIIIYNINYWRAKNFIHKFKKLVDVMK